MKSHTITPLFLAECPFCGFQNGEASALGAAAVLVDHRQRAHPRERPDGVWSQSRMDWAAQFVSETVTEQEMQNVEKENAEYAGDLFAGSFGRQQVA